MLLLILCQEQTLDLFSRMHGWEKVVHVLDVGSRAFVLGAQTSQGPDNVSRQSRSDLTASPMAALPRLVGRSLE